MRVWALTDGEVKEGKYLVIRRDGTIPDWSHFVLSAHDPAAPAALRAYSIAARNAGFDAEFCKSVVELSDVFEKAAAMNAAEGQKPSDPDAGPHRLDNPFVVDMMQQPPRYDLTDFRGILIDWAKRRANEVSDQLEAIAFRLIDHPDEGVRALAATYVANKAAAE